MSTSTAHQNGNLVTHSNVFRRPLMLDISAKHGKL